MKKSKTPVQETIRQIKVIIADDHPVYRKGIVSTLAQENFIKQVSQAANGEEVIDLLKHELHDVVLMDIRMSPLDGIQTTEQIVKKFPGVKVIALSSFDDESLVIDIMKKGASGYLLKSSDREEIILAIQKVLDGHNYYSEEIQNLLHQNIDNLIYNNGERNSEILNQSVVREVIFLLYHEKTNKEISTILNKSLRTIEAYRRQIMKTTNSTNFAGIIKYATKMGIMDDVKLKVKFRENIKINKL